MNMRIKNNSIPAKTVENIEPIKIILSTSDVKL